MAFYSDPLKVDEYEKICIDYDGTKLYKVLERHLAKNATLLELGCGPGNDIEYFQNQYNVTGSDLSEEFLARCRKRFTDIPFQKLDAVSIETDKKYDCIFSNKVLHHLNRKNLERSLKRQQQLIKPNGIFARTFWLGNKEFTMEGLLFIFHDREALLNVVSNYFTLLETYDYKEFEEGDSL